MEFFYLWAIRQHEVQDSEKKVAEILIIALSKLEENQSGL